MGAGAFQACEVILGAMIKHASQETLQEQACRALRTLLAHDENAVTVAKHNGVVTILQAIDGFPANAQVRDHGSACLGLMSLSSAARAHSTELRVAALLISNQRVVGS